MRETLTPIAGESLENYEMPDKKSELPKESNLVKEREKNPENYERLKNLLKEIAEEMNLEFRRYLDPEKAGDIFEEDCSVRMNAFQNGEDGPYGKKEIENDKTFIEREMLEWSGAENPKVRNYYKNTYGAWKDSDTEELQIKQTLAKWEALEDKRMGHLLEMAIVGIFHKVFKDSDFSVMRSAKDDDYRRGADTVIVDKETGKVICAFDEVNDEPGKSDRREGKLKHIREKARKHGGELKYGFTFEKDEKGNRRLVKKYIKDIPMFCLNLSKNELKKVMHEMEFDLNKNPRKAELEIFDKMVSLMAAQTESLLHGSEYVNEKVMENLESIPSALKKMKDIKDEKFGDVRKLNLSRIN